MKKLFNPETLDLWKQIDAENWQNLIDEIIEMFFKTNEYQFKNLTTAWNNKDYNLVRRSAHTLKSSCGNVGAEKSFEILDTIERRIENKQIEGIENLMNDFFKTHEKSLEEIKHYQKTIMPPALLN